MNQRQWQCVESCVRKEQVLALQHYNKGYYNELAEILDELYDYAHNGLQCNPNALECKDHLTDE